MVFWPVTGKLSRTGVTVATGPMMPVPDKPTNCMPVPVLSVKLREAMRVPGAVRMKVTVTTHGFPPGNAVGAAQGSVSVKSVGFVPTTAMSVRSRGWLPAAVKVNDCGALDVPVFWVAKVRAPGPKAMPGEFAAPILAMNAFVVPAAPKVAWSGLAVGKLKSFSGAYIESA